MGRRRRISRGSQAFAKKLSERGAKADLAREIGKSKDVISRWASGEQLPTPPDRALIQDKLRISWRAWDDIIEVQEPAA